MNHVAKVALVTGASRGIGRGIALALAKEGYDIALNYHNVDEAAHKVVEQIKDLDRKVLLYKVDVADNKAVEKMTGKALKQFGRIDLLVNNAGIYERRNFDFLDYEIWKRTIEVNLTGMFNCCKAVVPHMKKQSSGNIINIASQLAFLPSSHGVHYTASKAGVVGFTRSLALELAPFGIRVNAIAPGMIDQTEIMDAYSNEEKQKRAKTVPLQRLGKPDDIANAVIFLCSAKASYITGETLNVNGGFLMR